MIIWTIKQLGAIRRAIAGRQHPSQLAWAVGLGVLLGVVPHGNLLAACLLVLVLSLRVNHAMAGLTAVATSFAATFLDPYSHLLGETVLTHPQIAPLAARAWQLPLVPWTDLNNTVVMGSFLIGSASVVPVYLLTYPIFRMLAPSADPEPADASRSALPADQAESETHEIVVVDQRHAGVARPHRPGVVAPAVVDPAVVAPAVVAPAVVAPAVVAPAVDRSDTALEAAQAEEAGSPVESTDQIAIDTRIDVIRMKDYREANPASPAQTMETTQAEEQQPMDEALNYLLRQLRDSKQRKVA